MTIAEREELIKENSIIMNLASDLNDERIEDQCKDVPPIEECSDYVPPKEEFDYPDDEDNEDEFAEYYDECENQSDAKGEPEVENYFKENPTDLSYVTFIRKYKNWVQEVKDYCEIFKQKYDVYPNILVSNRITYGRFQDSYEKYYRGNLEADSEEDYRKKVELGVEYNDDFYEDLFPQDVRECYFHTDKYKLRMMEDKSFGSGVIQLLRVHGFLGNQEFPEYKLVSMVRNVEKTAHPVIDMKATGKNLEKIMKEEGVSPKLFARIMSWEKPQAIYRWYYGETLPTVDTLAVLARILNRPVESLLIMKEITQ